jgi:hypothetical protein
LTWIWGLILAVALLWPGRLSGPFDGAPLDGVAEAMVVGVLFPALWWFHPRFLTTRLARTCVVALLVWKAFTAVTLVQDGWCVRFVPAAPYVKDGTGAPHSWDLRADWRSADPSCSAIMTRAYSEFSDFPAWFFNLPPPNESWPGPTDLPPGATVGMTVNGFLTTRHPGVLDAATSVDVVADVRADGRLLWRDNAGQRDVLLAPGTHAIVVDATLTRNLWQFAPTWRGEDLWTSAIATVQKPSRFDVAIRPIGKWVGAALVTLLMTAWLASLFARARSVPVLAWAIGASLAMVIFARSNDGDVGRWLVACLFAAALLRVPRRLRNVFGAFLLIGVPWLTLIAVVSAPAIGRFRLYAPGNDYWMYQRFAYRIVMQGYWLEGGSPTFWFQPFYRWIVGGLHLVFGDSSVGESYWDGACLLATALFAFHVAKVVAGFRWGIVAAVTTLSVFTLGTTWRFIGLGLSEISSAGLIYLAAFFALRSRHGRVPAALAAGLLATLGFYTRLNNLPMAFGVAVFALPLVQPIRMTLQTRLWLSRVSWRTVAGVCGTLCLGLLLFAWRTWHYTGVFSLVHGTQAERLSLWQPGAPFVLTLERIAGSIMMVLTMNDPPRFDLHALPLLAGTIVSALAVAGVPRLRELPLGPVLFCLATISGSLIARGSEYAGRFSIHVIAATSTIAVCAAALVARRGGTGNQRQTSSHGTSPMADAGPMSVPTHMPTKTLNRPFGSSNTAHTS